MKLVLVDTTARRNPTVGLRRWIGCAVFVTFALFARAEPARAATDVLDAARVAAVSKHKAILVHFGASWCGWCRRFEAFLADDAVKAILDTHLVIVRIDVLEHRDKKQLENPNGEAWLKKFGGENVGLPYFAILNSAGKPIVTSNRPVANGNTSNIGYPATPDEISWFLEMLRRAVPDLGESQVQTLAQHLRQRSS